MDNIWLLPKGLLLPSLPGVLANTAWPNAYTVTESTDSIRRPKHGVNVHRYVSLEGMEDSTLRTTLLGLSELLSGAFWELIIPDLPCQPETLACDGWATNG